MAWPFTYANLTTAQMASLDTMFNAAGILGTIPCAASGNNTITLTPNANTPPVTAYSNYVRFSFVASSTSTGPVTLLVGSLAALPVYTPTGSQAASGGIAANALYTVAFNQNLNGGGGGFQIVEGPTIALNAALTSGRNRMINGGMDIDQRNEGAAVAISTQNAGSYISDQTLCLFSGLAPNITAQRVAVTGLAGFSFGTQVSVNSGNAGVGAQDYLILEQRAEGINVADLGFGTSVAQPVSTGVWVNSSVGGQVGISLRNAGGARSYVSMTSATAGVWTFCPVANIPGDTAGTWLAGAGQIGITYGVTLMGGTAYQTATTNAWQGVNVTTAAGQTNVTTTAGATFIITGLSLEPGAATNTFDRRPYGEEFLLCERYYAKSYNTGVAPGTIASSGVIGGLASATGASQLSVNIFFPTEMAKTPTVVPYSSTTGVAGNWHNNAGGDIGAGSLLAMGTKLVVITNLSSVAGDVLIYGHYAADAGV